MVNSETSCRPAEIILKTCGILSPYLAVGMGVFIFKNGLFAVLLYHLILVICIVGINRQNALKLLFTGYRPCIGTLVALGGLLPGVIILLLWAYAKQNTVDIYQTMQSVGLSNRSFTVFVIYSCVANPFLEESFWRGCFKPKSLLPGPIDGLFAGYHAMVMIPVVKPAFVLLSFLALAFVSWIFRIIYRLTGGLAIPIITHIIADITILGALSAITR